MFLSNHLLFALRDHAKPARDRQYADRRLTEAIDDIEDRRNAIDRFARPVPVPVRINKETGAIIG
mgnify:FL=1